MSVGEENLESSLLFLLPFLKNLYLKGNHPRLQWLHGQMEEVLLRAADRGIVFVQKAYNLPIHSLCT